MSLKSVISVENTVRVEREQYDSHTTLWIFHNNDDGELAAFAVHLENQETEIEYTVTDSRTPKTTDTTVHTYSKETVSKLVDLLSDGWITKQRLARLMGKKESTVSAMLSYVRNSFKIEKVSSAHDARKKFYRIAS